MSCLRFSITVQILTLVLLAGPSIASENANAISVGEIQMGELFASQYKYYQTQSAGSIGIRNNTDLRLHVATGVTVAEYAPVPIDLNTILPPGKTIQTPFRIDFDLDKLPDNGEPHTLVAEIRITAGSEGQLMCQKNSAATFQLHDLHTLNQNPPEAIAVFIDPNDQSVVEFAAEVRQLEAVSNLGKMQRLFDLMEQAKIICMAQESGKARYPREILLTRIGGSYDCAFLYAASLENCGVPAAFVFSEDYILVLGQHEKSAIENPQNSGVKWNGKWWIPLDIRMLKSDFSEANSAGKRLYEELREEVKPFTLREAWKKYSPVRFVLPESTEEMQLGIIYAQLGNLEKAEEIFVKHLDSDVMSAAYNNLGNVSIRRGRLQEAEKRFMESLKAEPGDGSIYLNLAALYILEDDSDKSSEMFDRAFYLLGSYERMCYALEIKADGTQYQEICVMLREAEMRALKSRARPLGARARTLGARPDNKQLPLYWKRK